MDERLPSHLEAMAIMRRVQACGGFAAVLRKGDPDRGTLTLIIRDRGEFKGLLEREMAADFRYRWALSRADEQLEWQELSQIIDAKQRFDSDFWLIELDIAEPERFIAETIASG